jgi:hypothetical protein
VEDKTTAKQKAAAIQQKDNRTANKPAAKATTVSRVKDKTTAKQKAAAIRQKDKRPANKPAAKAATVPGVKNKTTAKQKAAAELASELKKLRVAMKETERQMNLRIDSRIAGMLRILEKKPAPGEPGTLPGAKISLQLSKKLRGVKVKPAKGKLKDLAHICQLVEKIAEKIPKK